MRELTLVLFFLCAVNFACQEPIEHLEEVLVYPVEPATKRSKRETSITNQKEFNDFVEEKLIQHTQALEHLVQLAELNEDITNQLVENLGRNMQSPKLPEKIEVSKTRRNSVSEPEHPIIRFAKKIPTYGILFKDIVFTQFRSVEEPTAVVENDSRRAFGGSNVIVSKPQKESKSSPWCSVAILCKRTMNPVCGYDDNFGYGKFDDVCHMLQVNCYWKYNFSLVPSCKPLL